MPSWLGERVNSTDLRPISPRLCLIAFPSGLWEWGNRECTCVWCTQVSTVMCCVVGWSLSRAKSARRVGVLSGVCPCAGWSPAWWGRAWSGGRRWGWPWCSPTTAARRPPPRNTNARRSTTCSQYIILLSLLLILYHIFTLYVTERFNKKNPSTTGPYWNGIASKAPALRSWDGTLVLL